MARFKARFGILACGFTLLLAPEGHAQMPAAVPPGAVICSCPQFAGPHYHLGVPRTRAGAGAVNAGRRDPANGPGTYPGAGVSPNERGLPRGRRYYGGRYFGSFNNRYYGPQYGYF